MHSALVFVRKIWANGKKGDESKTRRKKNCRLKSTFREFDALLAYRLVVVIVWLMRNSDWWCNGSAQPFASFVEIGNCFAETLLRSYSEFNAIGTVAINDNSKSASEKNRWTNSATVEMTTRNERERETHITAIIAKPKASSHQNWWIYDLSMWFKMQNEQIRRCFCCTTNAEQRAHAVAHWQKLNDVSGEAEIRFFLYFGFAAACRFAVAHDMNANSQMKRT